ncbi:MAG TPA: ABC transporter ATP-binding protein [Spirochaetota bacterium]|nr:ABC transporter ATP-binding protein [Spirochaetota bacterium]
MDNKINITPIIDEKVFLEFQRITRERNNESLRETPILEAKNIIKKYGEFTVIPGLNFKIDDIVGKSEIISILGPSGCGKSTILKLIAGLEFPTGGDIEVMGKKVEGPGMDRGMIFQKYSSFPFLNVIENISYPLIKVKKIKKKEALEEAKYWLDKMRLNGAEYKYPHQLSGGMQQRVAIARTLCMKTRIILMDEPFGALDRKIRWEMQDLMAEILFFKPVQEVTVLIVTHDIPEAVYLGDTVWVINNGNIHKSEFVNRPTDPARVTQGKKDFLDMVSYFNEEIDKLR